MTLDPHHVVRAVSPGEVGVVLLEGEDAERWWETHADLFTATSGVGAVKHMRRATAGAGTVRGTAEQAVMRRLAAHAEAARVPAFLGYTLPPSVGPMGAIDRMTRAVAYGAHLIVDTRGNVLKSRDGRGTTVEALLEERVRAGAVADLDCLAEAMRSAVAGVPDDRPRYTRTDREYAHTRRTDR